MAKKRSCRRTADEDKIHEKAVKMRKMTDEQLVHYVEDRVEKARSEGFNQGKKSSGGADINKFLKEISSIKGVGDATICKIADHFRKAGHINFCGESEKIILDMFLDVGTNFSGCKYARKESADD